MRPTVARVVSLALLLTVFAARATRVRGADGAPRRPSLSRIDPLAVAGGALQGSTTLAAATPWPTPVPPFKPVVASSATEFLKVYLPYVRAVDEALSDREERIPAFSYEVLHDLSAAVARGRRAQYRTAMRAATDHIQDFAGQLAPAIDATRTSLRIDKSRFLIYLMDEQGENAYAAFPIALGVCSDQGPKQRPGDLRSPESPAGERTVSATPFYAHPLVPEDPYPDEGCITRGIGVTSQDPRFNYLQGWTVMLHGTPDSACIGRRASHGCIRLLPAHVSVLYDYVRDGTKIVIVP